MKRVILSFCIFVCVAMLASCRSAEGGGYNSSVNGVVVKGTDGKDIDISKLQGVWVVGFWVPNNTDSQKSLGELAAALRNPALKGVNALIITRGKDDNEKRSATADAARNKWPVRIGFDPMLRVANFFKVETPLPVFYIVGKDHKIKSQPIRKLTGRIRNLSFQNMISLALRGATIPAVDFIEMDESDADSHKFVGKTPPGFSLRDLRGRAVNPLMFKGSKNLILVFWRPSCPHCRRELPRLREFMHNSGKKYSVEILALATDFGNTNLRQDVEASVSELLIDFPVGVVADKNLAMKYGATRVPLMYIINKNGVVCEALSGEHEDASEILNSIFSDPARMGMKK